MKKPPFWGGAGFLGRRGARETPARPHRRVFLPWLEERPGGLSVVDGFADLGAAAQDGAQACAREQGDRKDGRKRNQETKKEGKAKRRKDKKEIKDEKKGRKEERKTGRKEERKKGRKEERKKRRKEERKR